MKCEIIYLPEVEFDYENLSRRQQLITDKAIKKVQENLLSNKEEDYVKHFEHKHGRNFTGYLKIKLLNEEIRVIYKLVRTESKTLIIVIGIREDEDIHKIEQKRRNQ